MIMLYKYIYLLTLHQLPLTPVCATQQFIQLVCNRFSNRNLTHTGRMVGFPVGELVRVPADPKFSWRSRTSAAQDQRPTANSCGDWQTPMSGSVAGRAAAVSAEISIDWLCRSWLRTLVRGTVVSLCWRVGDCCTAAEPRPCCHSALCSDSPLTARRNRPPKASWHRQDDSRQVDS